MQVHPAALPLELVDLALAVAFTTSLVPIGPISTDFRELDVLQVSTAALRRVGFGSRWAIHPAQVPVITRRSCPQLSNWRLRGV